MLTLYDPTEGLNRDQLKTYNDAIYWYQNDPSEPFEISGGPGTGKTFLINRIIDGLMLDRSRIAPMSYTGAAAINMRTKGMMNAATIHSWLYMAVEVPVLDENGRQVIDPIFNKPKITRKFIERPSIDADVIIIDEGGSVPNVMRKCIEKHRIPVIVAGDLDQLPPPMEGESGYFKNPSKVHYLTEIMRQNMDRGIIYLSHRAKRGLPINNGYYGDTLVIWDDELTDQMITRSQVVICGKNKTRDYLTNHIRKDILHRYSQLPSIGERLVCRKNNWSIEVDGINLTNGLLGNAISSPNISSMNKDHTKFKMDFKPDLCSLGFYDLECDYKYFTANHELRVQLKENPYSFGEKFEFGYAITTHMAQGSEYNNGIYIEEFLNPNINNKLNYVGLSRFRQFCIYVKRKPRNFYFTNFRTN